MLFVEPIKDQAILREIPLRVLAHLGDAVLDLFEREHKLIESVSAKQLHKNVTARVSAASQAQILDKISEKLTENELDLVRRARNVKVSGRHRSSQNIYRKATAFEALIGFLHLCDQDRLKEILILTAELNIE